MKVTLIGAGGKMGCRLIRNLKNSDYEMSYMEISEQGKENLKEIGITAFASEEVGSDKITVEQMALLEPALVETLSSSCLDLIREGMDEVIKQGVPAKAAREFLLGHINIQLAVIFKELPNAVFSDAANKALERGKKVLFKENWKQIFEPENVLEQVNSIT